MNDEEDLLGFHVFVAELELVVGTHRDTALDEVALLQLLQKIEFSVDHTDVKTVREYQRRCEQTLVALLLKGTNPEARQLISACLSKLYTVGDRLPLFSQVNTLQGILLSKEAFGRKLAENAKLGLLECMSLLCFDHGAHLTSSLPSLITCGVKHATRGLTQLLRIAGAKLVAEGLYALGNDPRHATTSQAEALRLAERYIKTIKNDEIRVAGMNIIHAVARAGAAALWIQGGAPYEEIVKLVLSIVHEPSLSHSLQLICSQVLGELGAVAKSSVLQETIEKEQRENKRQSLQKLASKSFSDTFAAVFCEAAAVNRKAVCVTIAKAWPKYIASLPLHCAVDESDLVDHSIEFTAILSKPPTAQMETKARDISESSIEIGHGLATGEHPMAQACVLYGLRTGVFQSLSESGQRKLVDQMAVLLSSVIGNSVPPAVCCLEGIRVLLGILGEVSPETAADLGITFMEKLVSHSAAIRSQAAAALGSLVRVDPACAATLITSCIEFLKNQVEQLASLSARYGAMHPLPGNFIPSGPDVYALPEDTVKKSQDSRTREAMHAVYGYATGLAALLAAAATTQLNVPVRLYEEAFHFSRQLIMEPASTVAKSWAIEMKAGYCILGALCVAVSSEFMESKPNLFGLWEPALGSTAHALILNKELMKSGKEIDLALQLWWRSEGLLALEAYILAHLSKAPSTVQKQTTQKISAMLAPLLEGLTSSEDFRDPCRASGGPGGWVAGTLGFLQLKLLTVFQLLPDPTVYSNQYSLLMKICSQSMSPTASLLASQTTAASISSVLLHSVLEEGDSHLGPWNSVEEPLEQKLALMTGEKGAPHYAGWECGMPVWGIGTTTASEAFKDTTVESMPFPQYTSLAVKLLTCQTRLFGKLFACVAPKNKVQLMESLVSCARNLKSARHPVQQKALASTLLFALLSVRNKIKSRESIEVAEKMTELASAILECGIEKQSAILRGAAEITALAAQFGNDAFALRLVKQLSSDSVGATSVERQCYLLHAIGCLFRSKGGMCLQTTLQTVVTMLFNRIRKSSGEVLLWSLHSLYLTANAAGLTFMPYVQQTLELAEKLMTDVDDIVSIRPYIGRLTNAMVAILGPELLPGSTSYFICKCLMRQMKSNGARTSIISAAEVVPGALEVVLYVQQLILFAPQAVPAKNHVVILMESLGSPHPSLRYTSAITLRHLTERDPQAICQEGIEKQLFHALDIESEGHISHALRLTLKALQFAQCPRRPSVWIDVCSAVIITNSRETSQRCRALHTEESLMRDVGLEEGEEAETDEPYGSSEIGWTPSLKTRFFACECLLEIFEAVGDDPLHFDLIKAKRSDQAGEFLIDQLQEIIRLGFSLSTGQVEALQPDGIKLLNSVISYFGEAADPEMEDAKLLFQFQAQFVSPLRQALAPVAPPLLFMSGSILAVSFLRSGLGGNDSAVLKQLIGLLVEPIINWSQLHYRNFSEWVSACVRVSILEAHAHCTVLAEADREDLCSEIVENAQKPILQELKSLWMGLLTDYMVLSRWRNELWSDYQPSVICIDKHSLKTAEKITVDEAWPVVLKASALHVPSAEFIQKETDGESSEKSELNPFELYSRLLDITTVHLGTSSMKVIEQAKSENGFHNVSLRIEPICICLEVLKKLLRSDYMSSALCPADICLEIVEMIMSIIQQVIHPIVCSLAQEGSMERQKLMSVVLSASELLLGIASGLTDACIHHPCFVSTFLDCILCCSSILCPTDTSSTETRQWEKGRVDSLIAIRSVMCKTPWTSVKDWQGTLVHHSVHIIGRPDASESVMDAVSNLLKTVTSALIDNGGEVTNGQETMRADALAAWTACSILDLTKQHLSVHSEISPGRLQRLLGLLLSLLSEMAPMEEDQAADELRQELVLLLTQKLEATELESVQLSILKALKEFLQEISLRETDASMKAICIVDLGPVIADLAHEKIKAATAAPDCLIVIAECMKYLILTLVLPEVSGKEEILFHVLIPLLIEALEVRGNGPLVQMTLKLVTHLNAGKHASIFKTAMASLSVELKQRFQKGIQTAVGVDTHKTEVSTSRDVTGQKPSIALKNFSLQ